MRLLNSVISAVILAAFTCQRAAARYECKYPNSGVKNTFKGISWDLTSLATSGSDYYAVEDVHSVETDTFTFYFNICGALPAPSACSNSPTEPLAAAWRMDANSNCHPIGMFPEINRLNAYAVDVNDPSRPAFGVDLTYKFGNTVDSCSSNRASPPVTTSTSSMTISVICGQDELPINKVQNTIVDEEGPCDYHAYIQLKAGCPAECPFKNSKICGGNGHCAYDYDAQQARCFCNSGYGGESCDPIQVKHSAGGAVGALFGGIFMGILGVGGYWWYKRRQDNASGAYQAHEEGFY